MGLDDDKVVLFRNQPDGGCGDTLYPWPPCIDATAAQALAELGGVFQMISEEHRERKQALPADSTEIRHA